MVKIESEYKPMKSTPDYWPHRKALRRSMNDIDILEAVEIAKNELTISLKEKFEKRNQRLAKQGKQILTEVEVDEQIDKRIKMFEKNILENIGDDECPVKRIIDINTSEKDKAKLEIELQDDLLHDLELEESEILHEAIGEALMSAEIKKEGDELGIDVRGKRVIKHMHSWKVAEEK